MKLHKLFLFCLSAALLIFSACSREHPVKLNDFHFTLMGKDQTHIDFNNQLTENDSVNFLTDQYAYIGSGVAAVDFNNDGLQDLFFAGGQVSCMLYLNKGDFQFEDITEKSGIHTDTWCTGVTVVD